MKFRKPLMVIFSIIIALSSFQVLTFSSQKITKTATKKVSTKVSKKASTQTAKSKSGASSVSTSTYARQTAYNLLVKANVPHSDFSQHLLFKQNNQNASSCYILYSKAYDCARSTQTMGHTSMYVYVNNVHNKKYVSCYVSQSAKSASKVTDKKTADQIISSLSLNRFIVLNDSLLKNIVFNSSISFSKNTVTITASKLPSSVIKYIQKTSPTRISISAASIKITLTNSKLTNFSQVIKANGIKTETCYTISYYKQNFKPFK